MNSSTYETIAPERLAEKVAELKDSGYRLVQICCTEGEGCELLYSFDMDLGLVNLKTVLHGPDPVFRSISNIYWNAFVYENEIHDLHGIHFDGMAVDFKGNFYRTKVKWPFRRDEQKGGADAQ